jgi:Ca-activated chloride channel homolog
MIGNYQYENPAFLWLLILIPIIGIWYLRASKTFYPTLLVPSVKQIFHKSSLLGSFRILLPILRTISTVLVIIALARPQQVLKLENVNADGIDIILALDLSSSMLAMDFEPNRLEASKVVAAEFIANRPYDRIGLVVFSGEAFTQCPITTDHALLLEFLKGLECGFLEDGTAIGMGLATAVNRLKDIKSKSKVIILLTDGVNNAGYFDPKIATQMAKTLGIRVYSIGVGSQGVAQVPVGKDNNGNYVFDYNTVEIDEDLLQKIAMETDGKYYRATNRTQLEKIYAEINALEKSKVEIKQYKRMKDVYKSFLMAAACILLLEIILRYSIFRTIP